VESVDKVPTLEEVAKKNRGKATFYFTTGTEVKVTLKHKGEEPIVITDVDTGKLADYLKDNNLPAFGPLNGETFSTYVDAKKCLVWVLPKSEGSYDEVITTIRPKYLEVYSTLKKAGRDCAVAHIDTEQFKQVLENMFGITEFPAVVVQKKGGDKKNFIADVEHEVEPLVKYVNDVLDGKIEPKLKSEANPEEPQTTPVKVLTGNNMVEILSKKGRDVFLEIYAPWCGHCKKLEPDYIKVGKKVQKEGVEDLVYIAKMDGTQNDSPLDSISYTGFPTLFYIKDGDVEKPESYNGARDAKGIWKYIKENHSAKDTLAERLEANKKAKTETEGEEEEAKTEL
jgi:protein disulfide isomerase